MRGLGWGTDTVLVFHLGVVRRERLVYEDSANCMYTYVFPVCISYFNTFSKLPFRKLCCS